MKRFLALCAALILSAGIAHAGTLAGSILSSGHVTGGGGGGVSSVNGTPDRITVSDGTGDAVVDIAATYVGQTSLTTLGTVTTGVWNAGAVTSSGLVTGTGFAPTASTATGNRFYLSAANTPAISSNGSIAISWNSAQKTIMAGAASVAGVMTLGNITGSTQCLHVDTSGVVTGTGSDCGSGGSGITIGSTTITSGTTTRILYDNAGVVGEYTLTGTGTVAVMQNTPTLTTPVLGVATGTSLALGGATLGSDALAVTGSATTSGLETAAGFSPSANTATGNRLYLPAANTLGLAINGTGEAQLDASALSPIANAGNALGTTALGWNGLNLATTTAINWANGEITLTATDANTLTLGGATLALGANNLTTTTGNITATTSATIQGFTLQTSSGVTTGNFWSTVGTASVTATTASLLFAGASTLNVRSTVNGTTATGLGAGNSYSTFVIGSSGATEAASGTHALIASEVIKPVTVTGGVATVTNTATLYVEDAITATVTGANYALWVDAGTTRLDGDVLITAIASDAGQTDTSVCQDTTNHKLFSGSGTLGVCLGTSSARYKNNIIPLSDGLDQITALKPVSFFYNKDRGDRGAKQQYGFIAEDVIKVIPKLVQLDKDSQPNTVDLLGMVPVLVKAVQELKASNDNLQSQVDTLQKQVKIQGGR